MFRGISQLALDAKGRLAIPSRYRETIAVQAEGRMVATIDRDGCLLLYPAPEWERIEQELTRLPNLNPQVRLLLRILVGHATECEMDAQGRVLLPATLREFAGLEKKVVLIGQGHKFELWNESSWMEQRVLWMRDEDSPELNSVLEKVSI